MKNIYLTALFIGLFTFFPAFSFAQESQVHNQIQEYLQMTQAAQQSGEVLGASTQTLPDLSGPGCYFLKQTLKKGDSRNDTIEVAKLQYFLKEYEGNRDIFISGVFDDSTFVAVSAFQQKYSEDILEPWGYSYPTGVVYTLTQKKINEVVCKTSFDLTDTQKQEIESVKTGAFSTGNVGVISPDDNLAYGEISSTSTVIASVSEPKNTIVTLAPERVLPDEAQVAFVAENIMNNAENVVNSTVFNVWTSFVGSERVQGLTAAVVTIPKADDFFNGAILFVIVLMLLNIFSSVTKQPKRVVFLGGSLIAMTIVLFFKAYYLFTPFLGVALVCMGVLVRDVWFTQKTAHTNTVDNIVKNQSLATALPLSIMKMPEEK